MAEEAAPVIDSVRMWFVLQHFKVPRYRLLPSRSAPWVILIVRIVLRSEVLLEASDLYYDWGHACVFATHVRGWDTERAGEFMGLGWRGK